MNSYNITSNYNNFDVFSQSTPDLINKKVVKQFKFEFDQVEKQSINSSSSSLNILLTGSTGYFGIHLIYYLIINSIIKLKSTNGD